MRASGRHLVCLAALGICSLGQPAWALPKPDEPIDPTKRASISTTGAVKPGATTMKGNGVVGGRVIRMNEIPLSRSSVGNDRAPVDVRETRKKKHVIKPSARTNNVRKFDVSRASDRPAAIPRIDRERFRQMLREYEEDRMPAAEMLNGVVQVGDDTVDLGDINRFVNPRAALEAQGIPVRSAGEGELPPSDSVTVPISREQGGGAATTPPTATAPAR